MAVEAVTPADAVAHSVHALGLDHDAVDLTSVEAIAASLRRAASFLSPVAPGLLVRAVDEALACLPGYSDETRPVVEATLNAVVLYGDLLELPVGDDGDRQRQLFLGPPAFVQRQSGAVLLMGVRPDGAPLLSSSLNAFIEHDGHVRILPDIGVTTDALLDEGLTQVELDQWLRCPVRQPASDLLADYQARVMAVGDAGPLDGVRVLDPARSPTYYRGRWRGLTPADTGMFVARRPQGYGADLWCFFEVKDGEVRRGVDLPVHGSLTPGADEAWRLQAAIDTNNGHPQRVTVRPASRDGLSVVDLFSPLPSWAQRRLDAIGTPTVRSRGALLSYAVPTAEVPEEVEFLETMMWLSVAAGEMSSDG